MICECSYYIFRKPIETFEYELDCTQHNGKYKKSYEEWKKQNMVKNNINNL